MEWTDFGQQKREGLRRKMQIKSRSRYAPLKRQKNLLEKRKPQRAEHDERNNTISINSRTDINLHNYIC